MLETVQTTTLPSEIALLARYLEDQAPGEQWQAILSAVQDVIVMGDKDQWPGWDVGTLFHVLQSYGDSSTAAALQQLQSKCNYYATMSLAEMQRRGRAESDSAGAGLDRGRQQGRPRFPTAEGGH